MGHELKPRRGALPHAREIVRLLALEFALVRSDADEGMKAATSVADWIERAPARIFLGHDEEALATAARLRALPCGDAVAIKFGDDAHSTRRIVVIPGESIKFGYGSAEEEAAAKELIERCARVLDCDVVAF